MTVPPSPVPPTPPVVPPPADMVPGYPLRLSARLDEPLSRGLWLVKWLLVIPHYIVLAFLWLAFLVLSVVAFFAILATGKYPRSIFDFTVGVLRWSWRVNFYAYSALGTDAYPPFTLADVPDYPARLDVAYPEHLSRGLVLVKWWLLAIPHYIVVGLLVSGITWATNDERWSVGGGLITILTIVAGVVLLATGSYPKPLFDLLVGLNRWVFRVAAYAGLMTDSYPPFRLDMGEYEPGQAPPPPAPRPLQPGVSRPPARWGTGRVIAAIIASMALLFGSALAAGGGAVLLAGAVGRDADDFLTTPRVTLTTPGYAVVADDLEIESDGPEWAYPNQVLGDVRIRVRGEEGSTTFVGIADTRDVDAYLSGVPYSTLEQMRDGAVRYRSNSGTSTPQAPADADFWTASASGSGQVVLTWPAQRGDWSVVVMNADAQRGLTVRADVGATVPALRWIGLGLVVAGVVMLAIGALVLVLALAGRRSRTAAVPPPPAPQDQPY